ncbi:molybdenum cofactor guanylyltransferase [Leeuwenhoekiella aestuarii]|uniref:Probable molybdenum cofactor guanylyltransferase n=1 Tax=Leeuwenhoekiella aestuarii TaxID=2249426 RepID=A0A4Q0NRN9_9FLAO|nr:molybdenum cofactor guanylyltransferase [Leeuwenhoekiella aestuarii]RXG11956.1 molybdenum cofactor guanylyltransferase [Leeuwenhoekiella aestuarii]RXG13514.1 molybdenum cofactor guanylyltransferase [Leeuwenhoekiella aestuarii]
MNALANIPAYILCGGKSSRMGRDKGLVTLQDKPIITNIISSLEKITINIFLVTDNQDYLSLGFPLLSDNYKGRGPLGGIQTALNHTQTEKVFMLSCDIPLLTVDTLYTLLKKAENDTKISFATSGKNWHPLVGIYSKSLLSAIENAIENDRLKLIDFIKEHPYQEIEIEDSKSLTNINSPEELKQLEQIE